MSNQIVITSGAKVRNLDGVLTGTSGIVGSVGFGTANGVATLDSSGKVPLSQLPASVITYLGTWNASTNTPTLTNGVGDVGDLYICNVAGTVNFGAGPITFAVGDWVIYSGTTWEKSGGASGTVTSVAMTVPTGLSVTGSPITTSGTLAVSLASGYTIPTTSFLQGLVPYTGATSNVNLGEYGLSGGYLGLDTTPTSTPTSVGTLSWDTTYLTPKVITGTGNTTLQIGQEEVILIHNGTGSTLTDGQVVYVTGSTGELPSVSLADASSETTSAATLGVVTETIANGSNGFITVSGLVHGLNTLAYTEGDMLWLSETAGEFTNVKPISPAHLVLIGYVIKKAGGNGSILVKIQNTQELEECSDVLFTSLANNDILAYESSTQLWKNKTIANVLGYTPANAATTISTTSPLQGGGDLSANRTLSITQASSSTNGYLSSTDWNTFNGKQAALNGIGFVKISGTTISYDNTAYLPLTGGTLYGTLNTTSEIISLSSIVLSETGTLTNYSGNTNFTGTPNGLKFRLGGGLTGAIAFDTFGLIFTNHFGYTTYFQNTVSSNLTLTLPSTNGTIALTSDIPSLTNYVTLTGPQTITGIKTFTNEQLFGNGITLTGGYITYTSGAYNLTLNTNILTANRNVFLQDGSGTLAFTSDIPSLSGYVQGSGTTNYHAKFTGTSTIGNSMLTDDGTTLQSIGATRSNLYLRAASSSYYGQLAFTNGSNGSFGGISYNNSGQYMQFETNSSEWMRLLSNGNLLINTTTDKSGSITGSGNGVTIAGSTCPTLTVWDTTNASYTGFFGQFDTDLFIGTNANGPARFFTNATERMRITSDGKVGIGLTTGTGKVYIKQISAFFYEGLNVYSSTNDAFVGIGHTGSLAVINSSYNSTAAYYPLAFYTSDTERMRITSGGALCVNTTNNFSSGLVAISGDTSTYNLLALRDTGTTYVDNWYLYCVNPSNTRAGGIQHVSSTAVLFVTTSDYRLKENARPIENALNRILALKPITYNWKEDGAESEGFYAHELQEQIPFAVSGEKDAVDKDGNINPQGVDYSKVVPVLVKAIQEQQAQIEELKALINK